MENSGGIRASLAGRYASALFGLAKDEKQIDTVSENLDSLDAALRESDDMREFISSPAIGRDEAIRTVRKMASEFKLDRLTANFLGVLADNGRLDQLAPAITAFQSLVADHRNVARAEVKSARPLTDEQRDALQAKLSKRAGRDVTLETSVDPDLLGGITVQMGSQLIDASVRTKLNTLAQAMKG